MLLLTRQTPSRPHPAARRGFTVVEMLTVMAIIALLSLSVPAIQSMVTAGTFNSNTSQMNDLLKASYSAAIARNTYVWVGLAQMPNNGGVGVAVTYSPSGSPADVFSTTPSYLFRPVVLKNLSLATTAISTSVISDPNRVTSSNGATVPQVFSTADDLTVSNPNNNGSASAPIIPAHFGANPQTIAPYQSLNTTALLEITPSGQVAISSGKYPWLEIGLRPTNGNSHEAAVLQINSFTGRVVQFLP